jgi:hypothetical protein
VVNDTFLAFARLVGYTCAPIVEPTPKKAQADALKAAKKAQAEREAAETQAETQRQIPSLRR